MNASLPRDWLKVLEQSCDRFGITCLDVIIDQAGSDAPILPSVRSVEPPLPWHSLFSGLPEAAAQDLAPLLVRVDLTQPIHRQWLLGLMHALDGRSQLMMLASRWPFPLLTQHLGHCMEADNGGHLGLFRFYDPRLFALLFTHVLRPDQQQLLLRPAAFWSWQDRDGIAQFRLGGSASPDSPARFDPIALTDLQVNILCCASDATLAMRALSVEFPADWSAERRFRVCYSAMLKADEAGVLVRDQREAYVLEQLKLA